MICIMCKESLVIRGSKCEDCRGLEHSFGVLLLKNKDAAYNWAIQKSLDLAGDITGVEPGSSYITVEEGEPMGTVEKVKTTVARYVPPELKK